MAVLGSQLMKKLFLIGLALLACGCGTPDVTGDSVEDAMKEREAKAKALDAKQGVKPPETIAEKSQDAQ